MFTAPVRTFLRVHHSASSSHANALSRSPWLTNNNNKQRQQSNKQRRRRRQCSTTNNEADDDRTMAVDRPDSRLIRRLKQTICSIVCHVYAVVVVSSAFSSPAACHQSHHRHKTLNSQRYTKIHVVFLYT